MERPHGRGPETALRTHAFRECLSESIVHARDAAHDACRRIGCLRLRWVAWSAEPLALLLFMLVDTPDRIGFWGTLVGKDDDMSRCTSRHFAWSVATSSTGWCCSARQCDGARVAMPMHVA